MRRFNAKERKLRKREDINGMERKLRKREDFVFSRSEGLYCHFLFQLLKVPLRFTDIDMVTKHNEGFYMTDQ